MLFGAHDLIVARYRRTEERPVIHRQVVVLLRRAHAQLPFCAVEMAPFARAPS